jgi:hypothetical protein
MRERSLSVVSENLDAEQGAPVESAEPAAVDDRDLESSGLPGRPMALLIAIGLALCSAVVAWLIAGGYRSLLG